MASPGQIARATSAVGRVNPRAPIVRAALAVRLATPELVRGRRVLVVEDGPTIAHGSMPYGAGFVAATMGDASEIIDPRPFARGDITTVFDRHPHIGAVLPAIGYSPAQIEALRATVVRSDADVVVAATPVDLARLLATTIPIVRARYESRTRASPRSRPSWIDGWLGPARPSEARPPHPPRRARGLTCSICLPLGVAQTLPLPQSSVSSHNHQEESGK
jgi:predicted GTPase